MTYRITAVRVSNFKHIKEISIVPDADRSLIMIGGKNANGKTSLLDAFTAAVGGGRAVPADAVRHGADRADIRLEFNGGELTIQRTIDPDGSTKLLVRDAAGPMKSPQTMLDQLVAERFLDPIAFLYLPAGEQRRVVLSIVGGGQLTKLEETREKTFSARTELNRDHVKAVAALDVLPKARPTVDLIDVAALATERNWIADKQRENDGIGRAHGEKCRELERVHLDTERLRADLRTMEARIIQARTELADTLAREIALGRHVEELEVRFREAAEAWRQVLPRCEMIDRQLASANDHNQRIAADVELAKRRQEAEERARSLGAQCEEHTAKLGKLERRKQEIIAAAKLPVEDLGVSPDHVTLKGLPLAQASGAEKLRVALALAIAASPHLEDIWVRDGALLDDDSLAIVEQHARDSGHRVWVEVISTAADGTIVISDGQVAS